MAKPATERRKRPMQERSKATVEVILEAAARVLVEEGFARASTNRIARVAGVSIGSLYQYFPNKQALVRALLERHLEEASASVPEVLRSAGNPGLREVIRAAVHWHLDAHAREPALHQVLTTYAPSVLGAHEVRAFERFHQSAVRARFERLRHQLRPKNLEIAAFLVATCMESLTHAAVLHHPELLDHPEFADEMADLLLRYLER